MNNIGDLGLGDLDCSRPGDFSVAADTMKDVATFIARRRGDFKGREGSGTS